MKKSVLFLFMIVLLAVNSFGYTDPHNAIEWLLASNTKLDVLRLGMAMILLTYLFLPEIRNQALKNVLQGSGALILLIVIGSVFFIPQTEQFHISMYPLDFITSLESAVLLLMMGIQGAAPDTVNLPMTSDTPKRAAHSMFGFKHMRVTQ